MSFAVVGALILAGLTAVAGGPADPASAATPSDDVAFAAKNTPITIPVTANDPPSTGDGYNLLSVTDPPHGTVLTDAAEFGDTQSLRYAPDPDYVGTDTFDYLLFDRGDPGFVNATVTVTVLDVTAPHAADDSAHVNAGRPVVIPVLDNDTGAGLEVTSVRNLAGVGTPVVNLDGTITYTAGDFDLGEASFEYVVTDDNGIADTGLVTVTVYGMFDDLAVTAKNREVTVPVTVNDPPLSDVFNYDLVFVTDPEHGTVLTDFNEFDQTQSLRYAPDPDYVGTDSFDYRIFDAGDSHSVDATVRVTVLDVTPPHAEDDSAHVNAGQPVVIPVLDNDTGAGLEVTSVRNLAGVGTPVVNLDGTITYTAADFDAGEASFEYVVTDNNGIADTGLVTVTVYGRFDDEATTAKNTEVTIPVTVNDPPLSDVFNYDLVFVTDPEHGTVLTDFNEFDQTQSLRYAPDPDYVGTDSFDYRIFDAGDSHSVDATVRVTVLDDPPSTVPDAPTMDLADFGNGTVSVSFLPPASDGGSPITGYTATCDPGGFTNTGTSAPIVVDVPNGTTVTCTVFATNINGNSPPSAASNVVTPSALLDTTTVLTSSLNPSTFGASVTFTATVTGGATTPAGTVLFFDGPPDPGEELAVVTLDAAGKAVFATSALAVGSHQIGGFYRGDDTHGLSSGSVTQVVNPVGTPPGAPTNVSVVAQASGRATVRFSPPTDPGSSPVTGYEADCGGVTSTTLSAGLPMHINIDGLDNGVPVPCKVRARNDVGYGAFSAEVLFTPGVPYGPLSVTGGPGPARGKLTISWNAANGFGAPILGYLVQCRGWSPSLPTGATQVGGSVRTTLIGGLAPGQQYFCSVTARNFRGSGAPQDAQPVSALKPRQ